VGPLDKPQETRLATMSMAVTNDLHTMKSTFYVRRDGCVCYEGDFLAGRKAVEELLQQLLSLDAAWLWASLRRRPLPQESGFPALPASRPLTQLRLENSDALVADLLERDVDGYGRSIFLIGIDGNSLAGIESELGLESCLIKFALQGSGPIHMILLQPGDAQDFVFVPPEPSRIGVDALRCLGVNQATPEKTRKYSELRGLQLESVINRIIAIAFGKVPHHPKDAGNRKRI
jgi:hypothetical protein